MAALWGLDFPEAIIRPVSADDVGVLPPVQSRRKSIKFSSRSMARLTALPPHKRRHTVRHLPASEMIGLAGGSGLSAVRDLLSLQHVETPAANKRSIEEGSLVRVFRSLDTNGDGYVDCDEIYAAQRQVQGQLTMAQVKDLMWEVDDDMDGKLSLEDFISAFYR